MSDTTRPGSPEPELERLDAANDVQSFRRPAWWMILIAVAAFVLALFVGGQVIGVLMGVVNPPTPPLVSDAVELTYSVDTYGVDRWSYQVGDSAQNIIAFYGSQGGTCQTAPLAADLETTLRGEFTDASTLEAYCTGEQSFARFVMRWRVLISTTQGSTDARIDMTRHIDWFGPTPSP